MGDKYNSLQHNSFSFTVPTDKITVIYIYYIYIHIYYIYIYIYIYMYIYISCKISHKIKCLYRLDWTCFKIILQSAL